MLLTPAYAVDTAYLAAEGGEPDLTTATYELPTTGSISASDLGNGVWVNPALDETSITLMLQNLQDWDIRTIYVDVFRSGETLFPSKVFPQRADAKNRDWLAYIIDRAHARGIGVHAWMQTLCWGEPDGNSALAPSVLQMHPQWIDLAADSRQFDGATLARYVSPAVPGVTDALTSLTGELCAYDIDGINLDAIAYNHRADMGYNRTAVADFLMETGIDPTEIKPDMAKDSDWMRWTIYREDKLTSLVQRLSDRCRKISQEKGHRIAVSVVVQPAYEQNRGVNWRYQHWAQWVREEIVDATTPACFESDLPGLERQLWEVRSIHMGSPVACVPGFMLDLQPDATAVAGQAINHFNTARDAHPSLVDQRRLLRNAGFQYCNIMNYAALVQEKQSAPNAAETEHGGFWDFFRGSQSGEDE